MMSILFTQRESTLPVYDYTEIRLDITNPCLENPFTDATVEGHFQHEDDNKTTFVEGFCDSQDGSVFKIRFMPSRAGAYKYRITYKDTNGYSQEASGMFHAEESKLPGPLRVDPDYPWHFIWEGTGEHYFLNGTTCYYLMAFKDEEVIEQAIERLNSYKINRIRVLLYGRQNDRPWETPVFNNENYRMALNPWVAKHPDNIHMPEFDLTRFNVSFWQKYERMLEMARKHNIIVSVIFFIGGQVLATPYGELTQDEYRYYHYAATRLSAFSNITWDLGNEHDLNRSYPMWGNSMGGTLRHWDPYKHIVSAHNKVFLRQWGWLGMQLMQHWDAPQNSYLLEKKEAQRQSGRIVPQVLEEYGYEDLWEKVPGHRNVDTRRRCAWEIYMASGYQTNGESARTGTGTLEDTGGGWVNGRGDDSMVMLKDFQYMYDFFTSIPWWKGEPQNDLVLNYQPINTEGAAFYYHSGQPQPFNEYKALCLACPRVFYVFYLPLGGNIKAQIDAGKYEVTRFNPRTAETVAIPGIYGSEWQSPDTPDGEDWVYLLKGDHFSI